MLGGRRFVGCRLLRSIGTDDLSGGEGVITDTATASTEPPDVVLTPSTLTYDGARRRRFGLVVVAAIASIATLAQLLVAMDLSVPRIFPDELIYSELAKSLGAGSLPAIRGVPTWGYGLLYPLVISPAWALFDDPAKAFQAAKAINAVVLGLTAFPVFFLARRYVTQTAALMVSVLAVAVPSMLYAGTLLTEVALYPAFALALLAISVALRDPTPRNQLVALACIVFACAAKPLALVLVPAYALAVVHLATLDRLRGRQWLPRLRAYSTTAIALGALGAVVVGGSLARGKPDAVLGVYGVVLGHIDLSGTVVWFIRHLAELDLYVAVVPFTATLVLAVISMRRHGDELVDEFVALMTWTIIGVLVALAGYSSKPLAGAAGYLPSEARLHERNMFMVVPLLLLGLALWLDRARPGGRRLIFGCAVIAGALPVALPLGRLVGNANFQNLALIPWAGTGLTPLWPFTFAPLAVVAGAVCLGRGARSALACWAIVGLAFAWTTLAAHAAMTGASTRATEVGVGRDTRWIDHAVPRGSTVVALWDSQGVARLGSQVIWMNEFFNRQVGTVVEIGTPMKYALPSRKAFIAGGIVRGMDGGPVEARYVLVPCWIRVQGVRVARDSEADASVYRTPDGRIRVLRSRTDGPPLSESDRGCS